jgi:hypothetical protein
MPTVVGAVVNIFFSLILSFNGFNTSQTTSFCHILFYPE